VVDSVTLPAEPICRQYPPVLASELLQWCSRRRQPHPPVVLSILPRLGIAVIAVLLGCELRQSEVAALTMGHMQQRDGRWCIVDLLGKHGRVRTVPMPAGYKVAIEGWTSAAGVTDDHVFRPVNRGDKVQGGVLSKKVVGQMLRPYATATFIAGKTTAPR
jgi:integrase